MALTLRYELSWDFFEGSRVGLGKQDNIGAFVPPILPSWFNFGSTHCLLVPKTVTLVDHMSNLKPPMMAMLSMVYLCFVSVGYSSLHNVSSFRACCNLLASLSGYQYTRRAWKKEVMELLLDPNFFQMDISCIGSWRTIIDNLMTQDNTSFKELMTRVAGLSQSASINIFANREQVHCLLCYFRFIMVPCFLVLNLLFDVFVDFVGNGTTRSTFEETVIHNFL